MNLNIIKPISTLLLFIVIGSIIYSNTLYVPFAFDDKHAVQENPNIRITRLSEIGKAAFGGSSNRPVAHISFALNYYFHQYDLKGYHLVNILIHILTGFFLYLFLSTTLILSAPTSADPSSPGTLHPSFIAFFTALIWLVNPVQTQSVTYIVQRMNSMAAMFFLLSFLLYAKGRSRQEQHLTQNFFYFIGSGLVWIMALGCKQTAATLPFFIFLYEWYFFQDLNNDWLKRHLKYVLAIITLLGLITILYLGFDPLKILFSLRAYKLKEFTFIERVLTQFRVVIYYLSLIFYPHPSRLNLDYDFPLSHSLIDPSATLLSLFGIIGFVGLAVYIARKERLISFCILWFFGNLVIESTVIPLDIIYEHRVYLPSTFVLLLSVMLAVRYIKPKWLLYAIFFVVVTLCSVWTYERNGVWSNALAFWQDGVEKSPNKARPHVNLGKTLENQGMRAEALRHYSKAVQLDTDNPEGHYNLGTVLAGQGKLREAAQHFAEALRIDPAYVKAHVNLGNILAGQGNFNEAARHYSEALRLDPNFVEVHNNLGAILLRLGKINESLSHFREVLRVKPDNELALENIKMALASKKKAEEAVAVKQEAVEHKTDDRLFHYNMGMSYQRNGELDKAIDQYKKTLSIQPAFLEALNNLAIIYISKEEYDQALPLFKQIIEIVPDHSGTYYNIACIYALQHKIEESVYWLKEAIKRGYNNWELIKTDKDLENIRESSLYKALIKDH